ncbi:WG repeat-containing protein [Fibrella aquatilis]|uniref:WG repeat-containing protein n=1 Tax=Fibrella aquatilis TaxID=2817059 RepID=A0A939G372_9BACT|nr:WG repeat-containing protein [Fibrella aquatilis]MBO0929610.1 WG repeat-containing protein [Fibrella aquatilis]
MRFFYMLLVFCYTGSLAQKRTDSTKDLRSAIAITPSSDEESKFKNLESNLRSEKDTLKVVFSDIRLGASDFSDHLCKFDFGNKYGFIDRQGRVVIKPTMRFVQDFKNGFAIYHFKNQYGFINKKGKLAIQCKYDDAGIFSKDRLAPVRKNGRWGYVDTTGKEAIELKYISVNNFSDGVAQVTEFNGNQSIINVKGEIISKDYGRYHSTGDFKNGLAQVSIEDTANRSNILKFGFIDKSGKLKIPLIYESGFDFSEGFCSLVYKKKYGIIDTTGKTLVPFDYDMIWPYSEGQAICMKGEKYGLLDLKGKHLPLNFKIIPVGVSSGLICAIKGEMRGYIDTSGKIAIPFIYESVRKFSNGMGYVRRANGKSFFITEQGKCLFPCD